MEENCGTTQEEEDRLDPLLGVSPPEMLGDFCSEGGGDRFSGPVSMPVCFLVREQAKSLVAIQDLQKRLQHIEGFQDDVMTAIHDVQDSVSDAISVFHEGSPICNSSKHSSQLLSKSKSSPQHGAPEVPKMPAVSPSDTRQDWISDSQKQNTESERVAPNMGSIRTKDSAPESDKQDSGLDSDCREPGQESNPPQCEFPYPYHITSTPIKKDSDELLDLLDEIGERSVILKQNNSIAADESNSSQELVQEVAKLRYESMGLYDMLQDVKEERDILKDELANLENSTGKLALAKFSLEDKFKSLLLEKHKLETKTVNFRPVSTPASKIADFAKEMSYKVDPESVSAVLKETNVIDLQKQVLTSMMENEVLRSKLNQVGQMFVAKQMEKEYLEKLLREEVRQLSSENEQLRYDCECQQVTNTNLVHRVKMLERVVHSMTAENRHLNSQTGETFVKSALPTSKKMQRHCVVSSAGSPTYSGPRRFSLPVQLAANGVNVTCTRSKLLTDTSSFIDVTIDDPEEIDAEDDTLAMALPPFECNDYKSSTPIHTRRIEQSKYVSPVRSSNSNVTFGSGRKPNKRLTFSSTKTFSENFVPARRSKIPPNSSVCDTSPSRKTADSVLYKPLESIQEKASGSSEFPFYTILEKLKASSDYKTCRKDIVRTPSGSKGSLLKSENPVPSQNACSDSHDDSASHKRSGNKTINKRIQEILDRITSESDCASTV